MKIKDLKIMIKEAMDDNSILLSQPTALFEANYGRVKNKIENQMVTFVMISAFRGGMSREENMRNQKALEQSVAGAGFPWTKMPGSGYVEEPESTPESGEEFEVDPPELTEAFEGDDDFPQAESVEVKENSILIWDEIRPDQPRSEDTESNLFELAKFLAKKYNQDSFIYGESVETKRTGQEQMLIKLYNKNGEPIDEPWAGPWTTLTQIDDDDVFWSTIGSKKAKLTELQDKYRKLPVKSKHDAMKKQHYLNAVKGALRHIDNS